MSLPSIRPNAMLQSHREYMRDPSLQEMFKDVYNVTMKEIADRLNDQTNRIATDELLENNATFVREHLLENFRWFRRELAETDAGLDYPADGAVPKTPPAASAAQLERLGPEELAFLNPSNATAWGEVQENLRKMLKEQIEIESFVRAHTEVMKRFTQQKLESAGVTHPAICKSVLGEIEANRRRYAAEARAGLAKGETVLPGAQPDPLASIVRLVPGADVAQPDPGCAEAAANGAAHSAQPAPSAAELGVDFAPPAPLPRPLSAGALALDERFAVPDGVLGSEYMDRLSQNVTAGADQRYWLEIRRVMGHCEGSSRVYAEALELERYVSDGPDDFADEDEKRAHLAVVRRTKAALLALKSYNRSKQNLMLEELVLYQEVCRHEAELRRQEEAYTPTPEQAERTEAFMRAATRRWGELYSSEYRAALLDLNRPLKDSEIANRLIVQRGALAYALHEVPREIHGTFACLVDTCFNEAGVLSQKKVDRHFDTMQQGMDMIDRAACEQQAGGAVAGVKRPLSQAPGPAQPRPYRASPGLVSQLMHLSPGDRVHAMRLMLDDRRGLADAHRRR